MGNTWRFYGTDNDEHYINAEVISKNFETILGISDTMMRIKLYNYADNGTLLSGTNSWTNKEIIISMNYGLVQGFTTYNMHEYLITQAVTLAPDYDIQNNQSIFDFNVDDIFGKRILHTIYEGNWDNEFVEFEVSSHDTLIYDFVKLKILSKSDNGSQYTYSVLRRQTDNLTNQQFIDTVMLFLPYNIDTIIYTGKVYSSLLFDSLYPNFNAGIQNDKKTQFGKHERRRLNFNSYTNFDSNNNCFSNIINDSITSHYSDHYSNLGQTYYTLFKKYYQAGNFEGDNSYTDELIYFNGNDFNFGNQSANQITSDKTQTCDGQIHFLANNSGFIYNWNFGDGNNSSDENPIHTYTNQGSYEVSLVLIDPLFFDTIEINNYTIEFSPYQIANYPPFDIFQGNICGEFDLETNLTSSLMWEVNGVTGNLSNFNHIFTQPGNFQINLHEYQGVCDFVNSKTVYVDTIAFPSLNTCGATDFNETSNRLLKFKVNDNQVFPNNLIKDYSFLNGCIKFDLEVNANNTILYNAGWDTPYDGSQMFDPSYNKDAAVIHIDFNDNGVFEQSEIVASNMEETFFLEYSYENETEFVLNIPTSGVVYNKYLRMRLSVGSEENPCNGFNRYDFSLKLINVSLSNKEIDKTEFHLHPNPSSDFISFRNVANSEIFIQDINGKKVSEELYSLLENQIDIRNLNSGMYFLKIDNKSYKFIKE